MTTNYCLPVLCLCIFCQCTPTRAFNWPLVPDIRVDPAHEQLFDALLVLCITCQATLQKSYLWEKKYDCLPVLDGWHVCCLCCVSKMSLSLCEEGVSGDNCGDWLRAPPHPLCSPLTPV